MNVPYVRTAFVGADEPSFRESAAKGLLYVFVLAPAFLLAPYASHPFVEHLFANNPYAPIDGLVWVFVVLGPPVVFGFGNRGLVPAFLFVFPVTHALHLLLFYESHLFLPPGFVYPGVRPPYLQVLLFTIPIALVYVAVGYPWGWGIGRLSERRA